MTTVSAVKARLVTLFAAACPTAQVIYGNAAAVTVTLPYFIEVGRRVPGTRELAHAGALNAREEYFVEVVITGALSGADTMQTVDAAVEALYAACAAAVVGRDQSADPAGVLEMWPFGDWGSEDEADSDGRYSTWRFGVRVKATNS